MSNKHWKNYEKASKLIENEKKYSIWEAIELTKKGSYTKFQSTVELHINTVADPKYNDQMLRWTVVLPHGTWKSVKIAAFVSDDKIEEAKECWCYMVGNKDLLEDIEKWNISFDTIVTTPDMMKDLAKVAKILWPKWLMPSPKAWTVTTKITDTIKEIIKWRVEYKLDKYWIVHAIVGNVWFENKQLEDNVNSLIESVNSSKPAWIKWKLIKSIHMVSTMWPWIEILS